MTSGAPFEELLAAARSGAEWAWVEIHRSYARSLLGYLRARGVRDAEDVLGDALLDIYRSLPRFEGDERDFRSWLFTIVHRRMTDALRAGARRNVEVADDAQIAVAAPAGDAEEDALQRLVARDIRAALDRLSMDQQTVLLLRLFGGLTIPEIAAVMNKQVGAVKALQRRGLESLRKVLAEPVPFGPVSSISRL